MAEPPACSKSLLSGPSHYSQAASAPPDDSDTYPTFPQYQAGQKPPLNPGGEYGYHPIPPEYSFNAQPCAPPPPYTPYPQAPFQPQAPYTPYPQAPVESQAPYTPYPQAPVESQAPYTPYPQAPVQPQAPYTPYPQAPVQPQERLEQMQMIEDRRKGCIWEPPSCCCFSLSTGSYVLASTIIGLAIISTVSTVIYLPELYNFLFETGAILNLTYESTMGIIIFYIGFFFILMLFCCYLIKGVKQNKPRLMVPYMIWMVLAILITIIMALGLMALCGYMADFEAICIVALLSGAFAFLETYLLLVVRALYIQLKLTKRQPHTSLSP